MALTLYKFTLERDDYGSAAESQSFVSSEPDGRDPQRVFCFESVVWREMGEPDTITVTIEPGRRLPDGPEGFRTAESGDAAPSPA